MEFIEELLDPDHEEEQWGNPVSHLVAGAIAGCTEHIGMFPVDTVKVGAAIVHLGQIKLTNKTKQTKQNTIHFVNHANSDPHSSV